MEENLIKTKDLQSFKLKDGISPLDAYVTLGAERYFRIECLESYELKSTVLRKATIAVVGRQPIDALHLEVIRLREIVSAMRNIIFEAQPQVQPDLARRIQNLIDGGTV
jgi:hypothetical protein